MTQQPEQITIILFIPLFLNSFLCPVWPVLISSNASQCLCDACCQMQRPEGVNQTGWFRIHLLGQSGPEVPVRLAGRQRLHFFFMVPFMICEAVLGFLSTTT